MLYHLLAPLAKQHILFNLFNYLTFRAAGAVVTALLLAFLAGPAIIQRLRERNVGQVIRAEGPASHHAKRGTPTMGGVIIILATIVPTLLWARLDSRYVVVAVVAMLWAGAIGFLDDYLKIVRGKCSSGGRWPRTCRRRPPSCRCSSTCCSSCRGPCTCCSSPSS